ncbi:MAG: sugar phosphate isomerase/epimerase [Verrucomicrobia bacterium]|jgi:sugar phosphate isomerase/epimerase|nr:sugar phosphate isomerase/epimerase [Verrucomicrobiota bacterium]MBT7064660.1 sugar phosphate isomerase/epimerase [Verrucomicrobiota bacterium]MBT7701486.1 sugar phosphate isomerase/epimerase [Verrucomicrobiota bacterium]
MMRISVWSSFLVELPPEEMVKTLVEHDFRAAELSSEHGWELLKRGDGESVGSEFKAFAADHGFAFPQAHFDLGADISQPDGSAERQAVLDNMKRWCDFFVAVGVKAGVMHPGGERLWKQGWERSDTLKLSAEVLQELLAHIAGTPLTLCLENSWHYEDTMHLVDTIDSPDLCVCMDTGHLNLTGGHWRAFAEWSGDRLKALHIADNMGETDNHILPYGLGTIKWEGFAETLRSIGYEGLFNFEVGGDAHGRPLSVQLAKLDYTRELAKVMLSEQG